VSVAFLLLLYDDLVELSLEVKVTDAVAVLSVELVSVAFSVLLCDDFVELVLVD